jgi:type 1 glutamine amidotransferase
VSKALKWTGVLLAALIVLLVLWQWKLVALLYGQRHMFTDDHYHQELPVIPALSAASPNVLVFSKTNAFRHHDAIPAADQLLARISSDNGWQMVSSENNNAFNAGIINQFDLVVLNNSSGTLYTPEQQQAFKAFVESGGGVVALHAAGGDSSYEWRWYVEELIRAQFVNHPMANQFQAAVLTVEMPTHPIVAGMPPTWERTDEWYNFAAPPGERSDVLIRVDEDTYDVEFTPMGADHPLVWSHEIGAGRVVFSALGHTAETYSDERYAGMIGRAMRWALRSEGPAG